MKIAFLLLLFSTSLLAKDGILFKTTSGDFLIELDYKHAPKTSRYFANLASSSLFIGVKLNYLGKRIGLRSEFIEDLPKKTTGNYQDFIQPQEFEKSNLKHIRGAVSLTTNSAKPKGTSSIGLIFNDAPELDGKAIVFGSIVGIDKIINALKQYPVDSFFRPNSPIVILSTELIQKKEFFEVELKPLKTRNEVGITEAMTIAQSKSFYFLATLWILLALLFFTPIKKVFKTFALSALLIVSYFLLDNIGNVLIHSQYAGILVLFMALATFRFMGNYE